ncbi:lytic transglycosylase domain-containing protein [Campylobacter sp. FMV-PI01]|uniref:Lytic transglycosylase domain-containing protein n=1 Tax=Campylobacter portucalensis TaxID=2608384 RepID=A0A6L5WGE0_9BACT|nr:lytic transglycosylase domain-containing protein [Campylobacter portucalensis]MSN96029.1 lytic transglycosylase domain-containing protein [Campylobacter portucalensis]
MHFLFKILIFGCTFFSLLNAEVKSFDEIKNEPKSLAKDYYIYRLITETKYNLDEVETLKKDVFRNSGKLKQKLDQIIKEPSFDICKGVDAKNIVDANLSCKISKMYPKFIKSISLEDRQKLILEFKNRDIVNLLKGFNQENPAMYFAQTKDVKNFFLYYRSLDKNSQNSKFDFALSSDFASNLGDDSYFNDFIKNIVILDKYPNLKRSLIDINASKFSSQGAFYLGINAIKFNEDIKALKFFNQAFLTSKSKIDRDQAMFWQYLITKDEKILKNLAQNGSINIYSLYAKEKTGFNQVEIFVPKPTKNSVKSYNPQDPFAWVKFKNKVKNADENTLKKMANKFYTKSTLGEFIYISNIISGYKDNFFPTPFMEHIGTDDVDKMALILAIARQESRFIQSAISTSYALGMMQFMPFVANDWAKKEGLKDFDQDDMFDPVVAYRMANIHIDWLQKYLHHPILVAYAYNGGINFISKLLKKGHLFNDGKYEPFLSLELITYDESRQYGKHVLANYVIYSQILSSDSNASILKLFETLISPELRDSFYR